MIPILNKQFGRMALKRISATSIRCFSSYVSSPIGDVADGGFVLRNNEKFRLVFKDAEKNTEISPWHDIPLFAEGSDNIVNFVNEIPKVI